MRKKQLILLSLILLSMLVTLSIRSTAQSTNQRSSPGPGLTMDQLNSLLHAQLTSKTSATNMTEQQVHVFMNSAIETNLAAQLWARMELMTKMAARGANIASTVRALECLRDGRTNDAIRELEAKLDTDIMLSGDEMVISKMHYQIEPFSQQSSGLRQAKEYRLKFPRKTADAISDGRVEHAFSLVEQK